MTYTEELERGLGVRIARMLNFVNQVNGTHVTNVKFLEIQNYVVKKFTIGQLSLFSDFHAGRR